MVSFMNFVFLVVGIFQIVQCDNKGYETYQQDPYNSYYKHGDLNEIPTAGSTVPRENLVLVQKRGPYLWNDIVKKTGNTVFKIALFEERVILAGPFSIRAMYDPSKVKKAKEDFGLFKYNPAALRGYFGSAANNGRAHAIRKRGQYYIQKLAFQKEGFEGLFRILKNQFTSILPAIKDDQVNVEQLMEVVTLKTVTKFYLGKEYGDLLTYLQWFKSSLNLKGTQPTNGQAVKDLTDKIFAYLEETPYVKEDFRKIRKLTKWRKVGELKSEAVFFVFVFIAFGLKSGMNSAIPLYLNLEQTDRDKIKQEANNFMREDGLSMVKKLKNLDIIDRFALEVFRYATPVRESFGVARKDFVVQSVTGNFLIKKGTKLTSSNFAAQRNPNIFRFPQLFTTTGDEIHIKENFIAFGGPYKQRPRSSNRKCLGQEVSLSMVKMFVVLFSRCDIAAVSDLKFTEKFDPLRGAVASDEPLKVSKFTCPK